MANEMSTALSSAIRHHRHPEAALEALRILRVDPLAEGSPRSWQAFRNCVELREELCRKRL